jgi:hypothetical protein
MQGQSSSGRSGCVSFEVWGGWLATIVSAIIGALLAALLSGREIAGLRSELSTKQLKLEEQSKQLAMAIEYGRTQAEALKAARMELEQLKGKTQDGAANSSPSGGSAITIRCSQRQTRLPEPRFSSEDDVNIVTVFIPPTTCWSEILEPPIGYRYWALRSSASIELGISTNMIVPNILRPSGLAGQIGDIITPRAVEVGKKVEFGSRVLGQNVPATIRLRNRGKVMAMVTFLLQPE